MQSQLAPRRRPPAAFLVTFLIAFLAAVAVLLSGGCGDDDSAAGSSSPSATSSSKQTARPGASKNEKWASGLCVAVSSYESDLEKLAASVAFSPSDDAQKVKDTLVKFLQDAQKRSARLQSDIKSLGDPDGKDGKSIQSAMVAAAGKAVGVFDKSVKDAQALNIKDPSALQADIVALGSSIEDASDDIAGAFEQIDRDYDTSELTKVAESVAECRGIF